MVSRLKSHTLMNLKPKAPFQSHFLPLPATYPPVTQFLNTVRAPRVAYCIIPFIENPQSDRIRVTKDRCVVAGAE